MKLRPQSPRRQNPIHWPESLHKPEKELLTLPARSGVRTPHVALLAADGVEAATLNKLVGVLIEAGAVPIVIAPHDDSVKAADGAFLKVNGTLQNARPALFDALVLPDGEAGVALLARCADTLRFIYNQYHLGKVIVAIGASKYLLECAGVLVRQDPGETDPDILLIDSGDVETVSTKLLEAMARQRYQRSMQYDDDEG